MNSLKELLHYDSTSASGLRWSSDRYRGQNKATLFIRKNDIAGCVTKDNYWRVKVDSKSILAHRIIWEMFYGEIPKNMFVDHLNGNRLDNKISNLRLVTRKGNARNTSKQPTVSGLVGVTLISNGCGNSYWRAHYRTLEGNLIQKCFSIDKLGNEAALQLAVEFRMSKINELNNCGAGYTGRHLLGELNG